jgi:hypothetical protein
MKNFKTTFFVIAMMILLTQTIRHLYVRCYYDKPSVLDKYHDSDVDKYIKKSISLDSLLIKYDKAYNEVNLFERGKTKDQIDSLKKIDEQIYDTKNNYRGAIEDWEAKENKIHEVIRFWICGLILIGIGMILYSKKIRWFGLSLIMVGLVEMIYWTSPDLTLGGATLEFLKYLNAKLILSSITFIILTILWFLDKNEEIS